MPAPTQLVIATSALKRFVKEEASYRKEYESQQGRIAKLEHEQSTDENAEYTLRQEVCLTCFISSWSLASNRKGVSSELTNAPCYAMLPMSVFPCANSRPNSAKPSKRQGECFPNSRLRLKRPRRDWRLS